MALPDHEPKRQTEITGKNPNVVLEIGVGGYPWPPNPTMLTSWDPKKPIRRFDNNSMYIGLDCAPDPNRHWVHFMAGEEPQQHLTAEQKRELFVNLAKTKHDQNTVKPKEKINFLVADAEALPFKPNSIDEIYIANVFGSQLRERSLGQILQNVSRVIKQEGEVVIRESITPQWAFRDDMSDLLDKYGFHVKEFIDYGSQRYREMLDIYGADYFDVNPEPYQDSFFCLATPK